MAQTRMSTASRMMYKGKGSGAKGDAGAGGGGAEGGVMAETRARMKARIAEKQAAGRGAAVAALQPVGAVGEEGMKSRSVKARKILGDISVLQQLGKKGREVEAAARALLSQTDDTHGRGVGRGGGAFEPTVPLEMEKEAIIQYAAGVSPSVISARMGITQSYVRHALTRRFGSVEAGKHALMGLLMENALACQVHAAAGIHELSTPQAIMSGAILTDKVLAVEKSIADKPRTINFEALAEIGNTLKQLREIVPRSKVSPATG